MRQNNNFIINDKSIVIPDTAQLEWQIIHDVIVNQDILSNILTIVRPEYFTEDRRPIWDAIVNRYNAGERVDITIIGSMFPSVVTYGGYELSETGVMDAGEYAVCLRDACARRRMVLAALSMIASATKPLDEAGVYAAMAKATAGVHEEDLRSEVGLRQVINDIAAQAESRLADREAGRLVRVPTGLDALNAATYGGFGKGELIVLAARPSVGKTAVMLQFAKAAGMAGKTAAIFSLEMTADELGQRLLYGTGLVSPAALAKGEPDWPAFEAAAKQIDLPILINDEARDLSEIITRMTLLHNAGKLDIAFIDYLSLIEAGCDPRTPLYQAIAKITRELKHTAKRLGIPVFLLSQLNREAAKDGEAPQLWHLRDSGAIEQDADMVIMLQFAEDILRAWVRKNRNGRKNFAIELHPNATYSQFEEGNVIEG